MYLPLRGCCFGEVLPQTQVNTMPVKLVDPLLFQVSNYYQIMDSGNPAKQKPLSVQVTHFINIHKWAKYYIECMWKWSTCILRINQTEKTMACPIHKNELNIV